jgi:hypothetical protein
MAIIGAGKNGLIYISGVEFAEANAWSVSIEEDVEEYAVFGDTWKSQSTGLLGWSGSVAGYQAAASKPLQDAVVAGIAVAILIYPKRTTLTTYYSGTAVFSGFSSEAENGGAPVPASSDFTGHSTLTMTGFNA